MSRRVRDLTQRLEDHKIEHRHWRYRSWRKTATGCDGLRVLHISIVQLAERQAPTLLIAVRVRVLMLTWENSIKELESSLLNSLLITHTTSYSLSEPERAANVLRLGHVYSFFAHEAGSTPALGFSRRLLYISSKELRSAPHFYISP